MKSKNEKLLGWHTIFDGAKSPYMTRIWVGRLRLHIFYRGDADPDPHDHPWDFWTFPLTSYVEEVSSGVWHSKPEGFPDNITSAPDWWFKERRVVPSWRLSFRPATHCHRVLGRWDGVFHNGEWLPACRAVLPLTDGQESLAATYSCGKIVTLVWRSKPKRAWGFLKNRNGKWCWIAWKDYVFAGGKHGPCE